MPWLLPALLLATAFATDCDGRRCPVTAGQSWLQLKGAVQKLRAPAPGFFAVQGGSGISCRGAHAKDEAFSHFVESQQKTLDDCKQRCMSSHICKGIDFHGTTCRVWTQNIQASLQAEGHTCLRFLADTAMLEFLELGNACRGAHKGDKDPAYFTSTTASDLEECKSMCVADLACQGVSYTQSGVCEIWTRQEGIQATAEEAESVCLQKPGPSPSPSPSPSPGPGWEKHEGLNCYLHHGAEGIKDKDPLGEKKTLEQCQQECLQEKDCTAIVMPNGHSPPATCWLRKNVDKSRCSTGSPYSLWVRPGASIESTDGTVIETETCCANYKDWPNVDRVTCEGCTALVLTEPYGGRCDKYCESFGHECFMAAEEVNENCAVKYTQERCDQPILGTSDMLCGCRMKHAVDEPKCDWPRPTPSPPVPPETPTPSPDKRIQVLGRQLLVNGAPLHLKGVAWNPVPKGGRHPADLDFASFVEKDAELMQSMGINAVRTYEPITDRKVLDTLWSRGIWVVNSVYNWGGANAEIAASAVNQVKDHPAILMWSIGNEWNYNGLYVGSSFFDSVGKIRDVARVIRRHDTSHPIASIFGDVQKLDQAADSLPEIDVWGINAYRGISFGDLFQSFDKATDKPMFFGEYGADAFNAHIAAEDQESQAKATTQLTEELLAQSAVLGLGSCIGGFIFEFADEWHKDNDGSPDSHDNHGTAPGGGPYPDMTFNEEWWGLVSIDRERRLAVDAYAKTALPKASLVQKLTS
eukprot:CAMPEP_0181421910 /NCGR_PEP_ID=MMETSP1110-20121109/13338_1 /TAXON_ID=174948 /ORGANISM="Symbiodinium sp., Strain CCMP421" /LENGTH=751 /DNA_ID=CAMNT_0023544983 /DNA_START=24 /DNA_END=2279 /DNA_ORIENTATION=+